MKHRIAHADHRRTKIWLELADSATHALFLRIEGHVKIHERRIQETEVVEMK